MMFLATYTFISIQRAYLSPLLEVTCFFVKISRRTVQRKRDIVKGILRYSKTQKLLMSYLHHIILPSWKLCILLLRLVCAKEAGNSSGYSSLIQNTEES